MSWRKIPVSLTELCIDTTLRCGQSFRWKKSDAATYSCAIHGRLISVRQDSKYLYYRATFPAPVTSTAVNDANAPLRSSSSITSGRAPEGQTVAKPERDDDTEALLRHYLNLEPNLAQLYEAWASSDGNFKRRAPKFTGVRILQQDAWEALVGFICSSNNNIARISQMMDKLCTNYGPLIGHLNGTAYYDMPAPHALVNPAVNAQLRALGFGYRAKYLHQTALMVAREAPGWLDALRNPERPAYGAAATPRSAGPMTGRGHAGYRAAHEALLALQGVGPKVADCVCLMGLGWGEAVPVDTHVWQIAQRDYKFGRGKKSATLSKAMYDAVGDHFRELWGEQAGWAHSVLFTADLRTFADRAAGSVRVKEESVETKVKPEDEEIDATVVKEEQMNGVKQEIDQVDKPKIKKEYLKKGQPSDGDITDDDSVGEGYIVGFDADGRPIVQPYDFDADLSAESEVDQDEDGWTTFSETSSAGDRRREAKKDKLGKLEKIKEEPPSPEVKKERFDSSLIDQNVKIQDVKMEDVKMEGGPLIVKEEAVTMTPVSQQAIKKEETISPRVKKETATAAVVVKKEAMAVRDNNRASKMKVEDEVADFVKPVDEAVSIKAEMTSPESAIGRKRKSPRAVLARRQSKRIRT